MAETDRPFDFDRHEKEAISAYLKCRDFYENLSSIVRRIIEEALKHQDIKVHSVQARAKDPSSFGAKAALPSESDPAKPKYVHPLNDITDLAGVRVITFFPNTQIEIDRMLQAEFQIVERSDKGAALVKADRFGYHSIHYLAKITQQRASLPEYEKFANAICEIQVRTILQHAWAEIEHDIQYKSASVIPGAIRRRFMALAGMLEIADREFQAIQDEDKQLTAEARSLVEDGRLTQVEITPDALKTFLNKKLGSDGRMSAFTYDWTTRMLRKLGFSALDQVEKCISGYNDDQLSRIVFGSRLGQTTRFEYMLLAGMGEIYIKRHPWADESWFREKHTEILERFRTAGIALRNYDPEVDQPATSTQTEYIQEK